MLDAFQRGDLPTLGAVVDGLLGEVWRLGRAGFSIDGGLTVDADDDLDRLEAATADVLSELFRPEVRATINSEEAIRATGIALARAHFGRLAKARGDALPGPAATGPSFDATRLAHEAAEKLPAILGRLDEKAMSVAESRFREGKTALEAAAGLGCGKAAVISAEGRLRRAVAHGLKGHRLGPARIDAVLSGQLLAELPAPITRERIRRRVLSRTSIAPARPFGRRLAEGLAFAAIAGALWIAMYLGAIPGPDSDPALVASVRIECKPTCTTGAQVTAFVLAPAPHRKIAIWIVGGKEPRPLLVGPSGGSLSLPIEARNQATALPWQGTLDAPLAPDERVVGLLSEKRLSPDQQRVALGRPEPRTERIVAEVRCAG